MLMERTAVSILRYGNLGLTWTTWEFSGAVGAVAQDGVGDNLHI